MRIIYAGITFAENEESRLKMIKQVRKQVVSQRVQFVRLKKKIKFYITYFLPFR